MTEYRFAPYSFSKLSLHTQCQRKFKYRYIDKVQPENRDMTALLKGGAVHSIIEHYPNKSSHKLQEKYQYIFDSFINTKVGQKYLGIKGVHELSFGLTDNLEPTEYKSKDAIFRGFVDYICTLNNTEKIIEVDSINDISEEYEIIEILEE